MLTLSTKVSFRLLHGWVIGVCGHAKGLHRDKVPLPPVGGDLKRHRGKWIFNTQCMKEKFQSAFMCPQRFHNTFYDTLGHIISDVIWGHDIRCINHLQLIRPWLVSKCLIFYTLSLSTISLRFLDSSVPEPSKQPLKEIGWTMQDITDTLD